MNTTRYTHAHTHVLRTSYDVAFAFVNMILLLFYFCYSIPLCARPDFFPLVRLFVGLFVLKITTTM